MGWTRAIRGRVRDSEESPRAEGTQLLVYQKIPLINRNPVIDQKGPVLLSKGESPMMLLLPHDIAHNHILVTDTVTEASILMTPAAEIREIRVHLQPLAAVGLHPLNERGKRQRGWQRDEDVDMIRHPADAVGLTPEILCDAVDVSVELPLVRLGDGLTATVCAENDVVVGGSVAHE